jgi:hypothetical protein
MRQVMRQVGDFRNSDNAATKKEEAYILDPLLLSIYHR